MPRPATGQVVERESKSGVVTFAFPIRVYARAVRRKEKLTGAHREDRMGTIGHKRRGCTLGVGFEHRKRAEETAS